MIRGILCRGRALIWSHRRLTRAGANESLISGEPHPPPSDSWASHPHAPAIRVRIRAERHPFRAAGRGAEPVHPESHGCCVSACRPRSGQRGVGRSPTDPRAGGWAPEPHCSAMRDAACGSDAEAPPHPCGETTAGVGPPIPLRMVEAPRRQRDVVESTQRDGPPYLRLGGVGVKPARIQGREGGKNKARRDAAATRRWGLWRCCLPLCSTLTFFGS